MEATLSKRQSEIIEAAIKLIGEGGIQALTIKNLSSEIGITESAIYRHFKSRTEILEKLLDFINTIMIANYTHVAELKESAMDRVKAMIFVQLETFSKNPPYAIVVLSDGIYKNEASLYSKIYSIMDYAKSTLIKIIDDGKESDDIRKDVASEQIAFVIMGSLRLTINQWSLSDFKFDLQEKKLPLFNTLKTLIQAK